MFSFKGMPSTTSVLSAYTAFTASAMLVRTVINEIRTLTSQIIPKQLQTTMLSKRGGLCKNHSSQTTLIIDEYNGYSINQLFEASELYLRTKITTSLEKLKVSKTTKEKNFSLTINKGEKISDIFEGICLVWEMTCKETEERSSQSGKAESVIELSFHKKYMEKILNVNLPYVKEKSNAIKEQNKVVKLYALGYFGGDSDRGGAWGSTNLDHPATFDTIAMDPSLRQALIDDLDRFVKRRDVYRRVGNAWKRGYLLYGPPGTGKSSLIASTPNYLKFNIYDMELTSVYGQLRSKKTVSLHFKPFNTCD